MRPQADLRAAADRLDERLAQGRLTHTQLAGLHTAAQALRWALGDDDANPYPDLMFPGVGSSADAAPSTEENA